MTPKQQKPEDKRLGMTTEELKAFTEMNTTMRLQIENSNRTLDALTSEIRAIRKETSERFDRIEQRWDDRMRIVEASAIECKEKVGHNKEDIEDLQKRSDNRDWVAYAISGLAAIIGVVVNPK